MSAWTPGPWLIAGEDVLFVYALGPRGANRFWAKVEAAGEDRASDDECRANTRLIAEAPAMASELATSERVMVEVCAMLRARGDSAHAAELAERVRAIRAILALIGGGE